MPTSTQSERLQSERDFHDRQAAARARALAHAGYLVDEDAYLAHESWIAPAFAELGDVHGKRVLDLGCGHGMASVVLARRGAGVTACDLSTGYLREAKIRAVANDVDFQCVVCNGEKLPFADGVFQRIWGNAILHHLDLPVATCELHRVLAPGGFAVFCEPWAGNRLLNWARQRLFYPGKHRTVDEMPLRPCDLDVLRSVFPSMRVQGHQLLSMAGRVLKAPHVNATLAHVDDIVLRTLPHWQRYCRYVVVIAHK